MIVDVIMPKLGIYEDDVELVEWIAERRQRVEVGDPLFVMETEKVSTEIEAEDAGILVCSAEPGYKAPIGSRIGYVVSTPAERDEVLARRVAGDDERRPDPSTFLVDALREMLRIRLFEERVRREFGKGDMPGFVHTYVGAEAVAVGVCAHLGDDDLITSTHRGHGHCLAKGVPIAPMVAELYGRETGLCKGRGGSMHVADFAAGCSVPTPSSAVASRSPSGGALAADTLGDGRVAVTFFGDGASNQGIFHESLNLAAIWRLPVVFVCENNGWAESTPARYAIAVADVAARAVAYGIPGVTVDAADVEAVWRPRATPSSGPGGARDRRCSRRASAGSAGTTSAIPRTTAAATTGVPPATATRSPVCASASSRGCRRGSDRRRGRVGGGAPSSTPRSPPPGEAPWPDPRRSERDVFAG